MLFWVLGISQVTEQINIHTRVGLIFWGKGIEKNGQVSKLQYNMSYMISAILREEKKRNAIMGHGWVLAPALVLETNEN